MSHLLQLILLLVIIVFCAKAAGAISVRYGQPAVFGEILMGLLLGPTALNLLERPPFAGAQLSLAATLKDLSELGVILLMFVAGLETELKELLRVGRAALWSAVGGVLLPMLGGALAARGFGYLWREAIFIGTVLTATSVSISAQTLMELRALKSKEGSTILGAAVIDDVLGIIILSLVIALSSLGGADPALEFSLPVWLSGALFAGSKTAEIGLVLCCMALFFAAAIGIGWRYFDGWLALAARLPASQALLALTLVLALVYAFAAQFLGQVAAITGSYLAGVLVTRTRFKREVDAGIHPLTYSLLVPVFFISIGLEADARSLFSHPRQLLLLAVILAVAILGKVIGCGLGARFCGFTPRESLRVGVGMISRGEVGLIVAGVGLASGVIDQQIFSIMVITVLITTMITPLLLRQVFPGVEPGVEPGAEENRGVPVHEAFAGMSDDQ